MPRELAHLPWKDSGEGELRGTVIIGKVLTREVIGRPDEGVYRWATGLVVRTALGQDLVVTYDKAADRLTSDPVEGFLLVERIPAPPRHT